MLFPLNSNAAKQDWSLCSIPVVKKSITKVDSAELPIFAESNYLNKTDKEHFYMQGNVQFRQGANEIASDELLFNKASDSVMSRKGSTLLSKYNIIHSSAFELKNKQNQGIFENPKLQFLDSHRFATATQLKQIDNDHQELSHFQYTTCEPGRETWFMSSEHISLNYQTGMGEATHAKIYVQDVPVFYFPYFRFPIDNKRHSGFLLPSFNYSDTAGFGSYIPYYWNIDPQLDTTFNFGLFAKRGAQFNSETRFLTENNQGTLLLSFLNDRVTESDRYYAQYKQQSALPFGINLNVLSQEVSEQAFFSDFDLFGLEKSPDYLERYVQFSKNTEHWSNKLKWQNFQTLNFSKSVASRPYSVWPSLTMMGRYNGLENTQFEINNSVHFFRKNDSVEGDRYIINPVLKYNWSNSYAYLKPQISYSLRYYKQYQTDGSQLDEQFNIATLSLDSGLIFERLASEQNGWLQTFEPRLFFLSTPYQDQSQIANFDSAKLGVSYNNLFSTNRFSGQDRIGDTQQITLGLSSKLINFNSGEQLAKLSIGQSFYFEDRQVQLDNSAPETQKVSDLLSEFILTPDPYWRFSMALTQQADGDFLTQKTLQLSRHKEQNLFNVSYRFKGTENSTELEQSDVSMVYPVNSRLKLFGKHQFSIKNDRIAEQVIGFSYESCCWAFSATAVASSDTAFTKTDHALYFQFNLKGLSSVGRDNNAFLQQRIPGYSY